jgi:hypothetical protein
VGFTTILGLSRENYTRLELTDSDKLCGILRFRIKFGRKGLIVLGPGVCTIKLFLRP